MARLEYNMVEADQLVTERSVDGCEKPSKDPQ